MAGEEVALRTAKMALAAGIKRAKAKYGHIAPVNIQGSDIEIVEEYKYLGVHLNNKLDWTHNTDALYKKGQSRLHLLRRLRSFGVCRSLLRTVVASVIFYAVVCWSCGSSERDRKRLNKLVRRAGSVLDCSLDSIEEVGERRMLAKLTSIMDTPSHPLHETVGALSSSFSSRLLHPRCKGNVTAGPGSGRGTLLLMAGWVERERRGEERRGEERRGEESKRKRERERRGENGHRAQKHIQKYTIYTA
ncbi:hypothetical protein D4764_06G0013900, partial [Takifugu flavidus]